MKFWRSNAARYDLCTPKTLRLTPPQNAIPFIKQDYNSMMSMIFGMPPSFNDLMHTITQLQTEINDLGSLDT